MHGKISWQVQRRLMLGSRARPSSAIARLPWVRHKRERARASDQRAGAPRRHRWQGQGAGNAFLNLKDAMLRTLQAADIAGIRAFAVHGKDDEARRFYLKFDFIPFPSDPMHLFVLLKEVRRIVSGPE